MLLTSEFTDLIINVLILMFNMGTELFIPVQAYFQCFPFLITDKVNQLSSALKLCIPYPCK